MPQLSTSIRTNLEDFYKRITEASDALQLENSEENVNKLIHVVRAYQISIANMDDRNKNCSEFTGLEDLQNFQEYTYDSEEKLKIELAKSVMDIPGVSRYFSIDENGLKKRSKPLLSAQEKYQALLDLDRERQQRERDLLNDISSKIKIKLPNISLSEPPEPSTIYKEQLADLPSSFDMEIPNMHLLKLDNIGVTMESLMVENPLQFEPNLDGMVSGVGNFTDLELKKQEHTEDPVILFQQVLVSVSPIEPEEIYLFNPHKSGIFESDSSNRLKYSDETYKISTIENNSGLCMDPALKMTSKELSAYELAGVEQTSNSGQTFLVSKNGSFLHEAHKQPIHGDTAEEHNVRIMITMIDMVKAEVTRGNVLNFTGNDHMCAVGVLFAEKLRDDYGLDRLEIPDLDSLNIDPQVVLAAQDLMSKLPDLANEEFLDKALEYQQKLGTALSM